MFIVVRHGHKRIDGSIEEQSQIKIKEDSSLTDIGKLDSLKVGENIHKKFGDKKYKVISSPYYRCLQTAENVLNGLGKKYMNNTIYVE